MRKIEGLELQHHVNLVVTVLSAKRSVFFSTLALLVAILTLALKILESFLDQIESLVTQLFGS